MDSVPTKVFLGNKKQQLSVANLEVPESTVLLNTIFDLLMNIMDGDARKLYHRRSDIVINSLENVIAHRLLYHGVLTHVLFHSQLYFSKDSFGI